jgi:ABC-type bacteriocin/lantibiotic exporter with double-glycine peptidase domain
MIREIAAVMLCLSLGQSMSCLASTPANRNIRYPLTKLIRLPLLRQATDYTCGVTCLQSIFGYYGEEFREEVLAKQLKSDHEQGTDYEKMAALAKKRGYSVEIATEMTIDALDHWLDQGKPAICLIQAWPDKKVDYANDWDDGHYVVAVGYDEKNLYFMDPSTLGNYTYIPKQDFSARWHDKNIDKKLNHFAMAIYKNKVPYDPEAIQPLD